MASETGVLETPASEIVFQGRLKPGELVSRRHDPRARIMPEQEIFAGLTTETYVGWLAQHRVTLSDVVAQTDSRAARQRSDPGDHATRAHCQCPRCEPAARIWLHARNAALLVQPMARGSARIPLGSMGNDTPLAALSAQRKPLFKYFHQLFAQVSNPPLDYHPRGPGDFAGKPHRPPAQLLDETAEHCRQLFPGIADPHRTRDRGDQEPRQQRHPIMPSSTRPIAKDRSLREADRGNATARGMRRSRNGCEIVVV